METKYQIRATGDAMLAPPTPTTEATENVIDGFRDYKDGWCYGDGLAFSDDAVVYAQVILSSAKKMGIEDTEAFPGRAGEIVVALYVYEYSLEFIVEKELAITFCLEQDDDEIARKEELTLVKALNLLKKTNEDICRQRSLFGSFQETNTLQKREGSTQLPLEIVPPNGEEEYPLSIWNASGGMGKEFVSTFRVITQESTELMELPQFSGSFRVLSSPQTLSMST